MKRSTIIEIALNSVKESHDSFKPEYGTGDVIHDCPKHVEIEGIRGKVVSHTLNEQGDVNYIDIDFGTGKVYENIRTDKVKVLEGQSHQHEIKEEPVNEAPAASNTIENLEELDRGDIVIDASGQEWTIKKIRWWLGSPEMTLTNNTDNSTMDFPDDFDDPNFFNSFKLKESVNEADYAVGGMFKAIADVRASTKKLFALHDKLQAKRSHAEDQINADMESLHADRVQVQSDMENDPDVIANVERGDSGPVAEYGEQLMGLDDQIAQLMNRKAKWAEKAKALEDQMIVNHKKLGDLASGAMSALRGENVDKSQLNTIIKEELINVLKEANTDIEDMAYELVGELALDKVLKRNKIDKFNSDTIYAIKVKALEILKDQV